jgi:hypothetical protein
MGVCSTVCKRGVQPYCQRREQGSWNVGNGEDGGSRCVTSTPIAYAVK